MAVTKEGEAADVKHYLDGHKISEESRYDRLYAVCTDLMDDEVGDILKVSEGRWQIAWGVLHSHIYILQSAQVLTGLLADFTRE